jgi:hypothetical protein
MIDLLGIDAQSVYWANQSAPKGALPVTTLRLYSIAQEAMAEDRGVDEADRLDLQLPQAAVLEVQIFDESGGDPVGRLETLLLKLETPTVADRCHAAGVAFFAAEPVLDITGLLADGKTYEPRAAVDLHIRFNGRIKDSPGTIEKVEITAKAKKPEKLKEVYAMEVEVAEVDGDMKFTIRKGDRL